MQSLRVWFIASLTFILCACGGGGGNGGAPSGGGGTVLPPPGPSVTLGDVRTIVKNSGATMLAYDSDDKAWLTAFTPAGLPSTVYGNGAALPVTVPVSDGQSIVAIAYGSSQHAIYFATAHNIYKAAYTGNVNVVAQGFSQLSAIAAASDGTVYGIDGDKIVKTQNGGPGFVTGNGVVPLNQSGWALGTPAITFDSKDGALYVTDPVDNVVKRVTASGGVTTIAGSCRAFVGQPSGMCWRHVIAGNANTANFNAPSGITYDAANDTLYVSDTPGDVLWSLTPSGTASPVAGYGMPLEIDGNGARAFLQSPQSVAYDANTGNIDVLEAGGNIVSYATKGAAASAFVNPVQQTVVPTHAYGYLELATGADGTAWVAQGGASRVSHVTSPGNVTEFPLNGVVNPWHITVDGDGNAWVTAQENMPFLGAIERVTPSGAQAPWFLNPQTANSSTDIYRIGTGPDGNPWFSEHDGSYNGGDPYGYAYIAEMDRHTGNVTRYPLANAPGPIAGGTNSTVWFEDVQGTGLQTKTPALNSITTSGTLGTPVGLQRAPTSLAFNPVDGDVWWVDGYGTLSTLDRGGVEHDYTVCSQCDPVDLAIAPDGTMWLDTANYYEVLHVDRSGNVTPYLLPELTVTSGIAVRPDGKVWVSGNDVVYLLDPVAYDAAQLPHPTTLSIRRRAK